MDVEVDGWAWLPKDELTPAQIINLENMLMVYPQKAMEAEDDPEPVPLFRNENTRFGIPREFFFSNKRPIHKVHLNLTNGSSDWWPAEFIGTLRAEQNTAADLVLSMFNSGRYGGIIEAKPGWGKTVCALAIAARLKVPTLVIVHKEFLVNQWSERIQTFIPAAKIGRVQQNECDFRGKTIVIGMVHSLGTENENKYPDELWEWPGLVITDECHRIGARTWAPVPPKFNAKYRLGFTATPRRKDRAENVFWYHLGPILFAGKEERLKPIVKRVWSKFKLIKTDRFNPNLAPRSLLLKFLCASSHRNEMIVLQIVKAIQAGRKCLVLSERLNHLQRLENILRGMWPMDAGEVSIGKYVGGMKASQLEISAKKRVIFATFQYAAEGLDIPPLDTLFLTTPKSDVEQSVGRILRPYEGKKPPIVVDIRDDAIPMCEAQGRKRDKYYDRVV